MTEARATSVSEARGLDGALWWVSDSYPDLDGCLTCGRSFNIGGHGETVKMTGAGFRHAVCDGRWDPVMFTLDVECDGRFVMNEDGTLGGRCEHRCDYGIRHLAVWAIEVLPLVGPHFQRTEVSRYIQLKQRKWWLMTRFKERTMGLNAAGVELQLPPDAKVGGYAILLGMQP